MTFTFNPHHPQPPGHFTPSSTVRLTQVFLQRYCPALLSIQSHKPTRMAHSTASSLTDQAATLAVSTRQWQSESTTKPFDIAIEDDVQAIEGRIERITDITKMSTSDRLKLDSAGTELWNGCRLQVMGSGSDDKEAMTMSSRGMLGSSRNSLE